MPFICSICGEQSTRICARCTKDACDNHLCEKCLRCSDCCECEVALSEPVRRVVHVAVPPVPQALPEPAPAATEPELAPAATEPELVSDATELAPDATEPAPAATELAPGATEPDPAATEHEPEPEPLP